MARIHGIAGESARVKGTVVGLWPVFLAVFTAGLAVGLLVTDTVWGVVLLCLSLVSLGYSLQQGLRRTQRFFVGARGEERVSGILRELPDRYHVFNDFAARGVHVDHVVVGPAGVFAVETKYWRGRVTVEDGCVLVDGRLPSRSPLDQVRREAHRVRQALAQSGWDGPVTPVLVFASDTFQAHIAEVQGTVIINSCEIRKSFGTERVILPPSELDRLVSLMENIA